MRYCPEPEETVQDHDETEKNEETVHLSLFNSDQRNRKLTTLLEESDGYAVLDTGCSATVCGVGWLDRYIGGLSDYQRSKLVEETSDASFTFGTGAAVTSLKKIKLPCQLGASSATITTDVVDCEIPLLLSKRSMKKVKMCLDFEKDSAKIQGEHINLKSSASGHYLLPLSF